MSDNNVHSARKLHESKEIEDKLLGGKSMILCRRGMTLITRTVAQDMIFNVALHTVPSRDVLTMCGVGLLATQNYTTLL